MGKFDKRTVKMEYFNEYCMRKKSVFQPTYNNIIIFLSIYRFSLFQTLLRSLCNKGIYPRSGML